MRTNGSLDSFSAILSGLAKRLGLDSLLFERRLQQDWRELVGEHLAAHTWPDQIRFKKLHLIVRSSVWMQQLTFLKPMLLEKLNARAGTDLVRDITFKVGDIPDAVRPTGITAEPNLQCGVTEQALAEASFHAAAVKDPELRERLAHLMAASISHSNAGRGSTASLNSGLE